MSSKCPSAPPDAALLEVHTTALPSGRLLFRFHKTGARPPPNRFNPNTGKRREIPEEGARFTPFPGAPSVNVPTLYAADSLDAAALESVFHDVEHAPGPTYPKSRLADWGYSKLRTKRELVF